MSNPSDTPENKPAPKASGNNQAADKKSQTDKSSAKNTAPATTSPHAASKTEPHKPAEPNKHKPAGAKKAGGGFTTLIAWLALLLAGTLSAGAWYGWQIYQQQQNTLTLVQANLQQSLDQQLNQLKSQQQQQADLLKQQQDTLMVNINEVHSRLGNTTRDWMLSEAHYLLQLGNQQAQLADNLTTAKVAFELADKRLQAVGEPALLPVRKQIMQELDALNAVKEADIDGIVLKLGELAQQAGKLVMLSSVIPQTDPGATQVPQIDSSATQQGWQSMLQAIWKALKSLVSIRYHEQSAQPLLTPEHALAIRDSLELKLNQARLAALQKNSAIFRDSINSSIDWLQRYFNTTDITASNMIQTLQSWQALELKPAIPDVSASRRMLIDTASRLKMTIQNPPADKKTKPEAAQNKAS